MSPGGSHFPPIPPGVGRHRGRVDQFSLRQGYLLLTRRYCGLSAASPEELSATLGITGSNPPQPEPMTLDSATQPRLRRRDPQLTEYPAESGQ